MKTILSTSTFLVFLTAFSFGQPVSVERGERIYKRVDGHELTADIFYTSGTRQKRNNPAIAFFHGGGWVFGSPDEFHGACERYARKGFVTFSFQYRLSMKEDGTYPHPGITPVESTRDARSALRWIKENAEELRIDTGKIVAGGQSVGGQLALSTALADNVNETTDNTDIDPAPHAFLLYSSNVNTIEAWADLILDDKRDRIWDISPYHNLKKNMPPVIAFHGQDDCTVLPYIINHFRIKMEELGNYYDLTTYPGRKHYLGEGNEKYSRLFDEEILERTDEFLIKFGYMAPED